MQIVISIHRHFFLAVLLYPIGSNCLSQNLVPNPSFETYSSCPEGISEVDLAVPWINPTFGTSDFFHSCSSNFVDVPYNFFGFQYAHTGEGYGGAYLKVGTGT
jgi:OmpA-OmpF porin, OOP family